MLYGEIFGRVQDLTYGAGDGEVWFRAFDVLRLQVLGCKRVHHGARNQDCPLVALVPYSADGMEELALRNSTFWPQIAEGIVIKPAVERWDMRLGRVALKLVTCLPLKVTRRRSRPGISPTSRVGGCDIRRVRG